MIALNIIKTTQTERELPTAFSLTKDAISRFCVDYHKRIAVAKREFYSRPKMNECIDSLGEIAIFLASSTNGRKWKIGLGEVDRGNIEFTSNIALYHFLRILFSLQNLPGTFKRAILVILLTVRRHLAQVHPEYIVVFLITAEEHIAHIDHFLSFSGHRRYAKTREISIIFGRYWLP